LVIVTPTDSVYARVRAEKLNTESLLKQQEVIDYLARTGELKGVCLDEKFVYHSGNVKVNQGFFLEQTLKNNLDNYLIPAVALRWDGVFLITGIEGSGKTTFGATIAKYLDPTFPGERINEKTARRHVDRIVFSPQQFFEAVDKSSPKQVIQFDEAILGLMAGDASMNIQKMLMKKLTLIRKKQLYIVMVIPSIFSMRMQIAVNRSRFLLHTYSPDGIKRGYFKFYNFPTKRMLYMKGKRDANQDAVTADFRGTFVDTEGLFYDINEYDRKKEEAINSLTAVPGKKGQIGTMSYKTEGQRNLLLSFIYSILEGTPIGKNQLEYMVQLHNQYAAATKPSERLNPSKFRDYLEKTFGEHLKLGDGMVREYLRAAQEYTSKPIKPLEAEKLEQIKSIVMDGESISDELDDGNTKSI